MRTRTAGSIFIIFSAVIAFILFVVGTSTDWTAQRLIIVCFFILMAHITGWGLFLTDGLAVIAGYFIEKEKVNTNSPKIGSTTAIIFLFLLLLPSFTQAQPFGVNSLDVNSTFRVRSADNYQRVTTMPWITAHFENNLLIQGRYDFDVPKGYGILAGYKLNISDVTVVPQVGVVLSDAYKSYSPELWVLYANDTYSLFSLNQYCAGMNAASADYFYQWSEHLFNLQKGLDIGVAEQLAIEPAVGDPYLDIGPTVKLSYEGWYTKVWLTNDFKHDVSKYFFVAGYYTEF